MARVLIVPLAPGDGLAHAGACHAVAVDLARRGHEVVFGYGGTLPQLVQGPQHRVVPVSEIPAERSGQIDRWFQDDAELERMVGRDRELIERERIDIVISDARPSTTIAAHDAGVPSIALCHFLAMTRWSTATRLPGRTWMRRARHPALSLGRWWDARARVEGLGSRMAETVDSVRRAHGLPGLDFPLAGGAVIACTSTPSLDPAEGMPASWRYIGPLHWSVGGPDAPLPGLGDGPVVYVSQGSSGDPAALVRAVRDLAALPVHVLVSTAQLCDPAELETLSANVTAARYLPGRACLERADVAVLSGGHLTASDAHLTGTPLVVVPTAADHWVWAARVQRLGTGIPVEGPLIPGRIRRAVRRILEGGGHRRRAQEMARELSQWDAHATIAAMVSELTPK